MLNALYRFAIRSWISYIVYIKERVIYRCAQNQFYKLFGGHLFFQMLATAAELNLFEILKTQSQMTIQEIASHFKLQEQPTRILLLGLVSVGILKKKGIYYSNSKMAEIFLTEKSEWRYLDCLKWQQHINYRAMSHFSAALHEGKNAGLSEFTGNEPTLYQRISHTPHLESIFQNAMQELSLQANSYLNDAFDFRRSKYLIDVGGGNGTNIISIARRYPHIQASVFDFPTVCEKAKKKISDCSLAGRLTAISGNIFQDPLPGGADTIIFCHFFTIWSKEQNLVLLKKAYDALPTGGRVLIFNMMQEDDESGPLTAAIGSAYFLTIATGHGMLYTWNEYEELFKSAGFSEISTVRLPRDHGIIVGEKR